MDNKNIDMKILGKIEIAIINKDINTLKQLLKEYPEYLYCEDSSYGTLLHFTVENGDIEIIEYLLSLGIDINKKSGAFKASALNTATSFGKADIAEYLLKKGAEIDISTSLANPLLGAIYNNDIDSVKLLIDRGIDLNVEYEKDNGEVISALTHSNTYANQEIRDLIEKYVSKDKIKEEKNIIEDSDIVKKYIEKHLGKIDESIKEIIPGSNVDITINIIKETKEKNYITLITAGMSEYPMAYSEKDKEYKYAELMIKLPLDWKLDKESCKSEKYGWPIKVLKKLAYLPHQSSGYITDKVIIPNGMDDIPLPYHVDTWLSSIMVCKSEDIPSFQIDDSIRIDFFTLVAICDEEVEEAQKMANNQFMNTLPTKDIVDEARGYED